MTDISFKKLPMAVQETLKALTPLERRFVVEYCGRARGNGTLAATLAGVKGKKPTIATRASQIRHEPQVSAAIEAWMSAHALGATELTAKLVDLAEVNPGPFVELQKDGTLKVKLLDEQVWIAHKHWIKQLEVDPKTGQVTRLILHDSTAALRELAKILKLYSEAPTVNFNVYLQQLSDEELMKEWEEARAAIASGAVLSKN